LARASSSVAQRRSAPCWPAPPIASYSLSVLATKARAGYPRSLSLNKPTIMIKIYQTQENYLVSQSYASSPRPQRILSIPGWRGPQGQIDLARSRTRALLRSPISPPIRRSRPAQPCRHCSPTGGSTIDGIYRLDAVLPRPVSLAGNYPAILDDEVVWKARGRCGPMPMRCSTMSAEKMADREGVAAICVPPRRRHVLIEADCVHDRSLSPPQCKKRRRANSTLGRTSSRPMRLVVGSRDHRPPPPHGIAPHLARFRAGP